MSWVILHDQAQQVAQIDRLASVMLRAAGMVQPDTKQPVEVIDVFDELDGFDDRLLLPLDWADQQAAALRLVAEA